MQDFPPFWRIDYARKQIIVPYAHLTKEKIPYIFKFLEGVKCKFLTGAPSMIAQYCILLEEAGLTPRMHPVAIFLGAEGLQVFQEEVIRRVLNCSITDHYGFSEGCGNASRCEYGNYHEDWEFGVLECDDPKFEADGAYSGRIIATGFANLSFPFIRYDIGDTGTWAPPDFKCPCGRSSNVLFHINGRSEDYIVTPEGNKVMRFSYLFKDSKGIKEAQVIQRQVGSIIIKYVPRNIFDGNDLLKIKEIARNWISPNLIIDFEQVEEIPRSSSGKFKPVVSELRDSGKQGGLCR